MLILLLIIINAVYCCLRLNRVSPLNTACAEQCSTLRVWVTGKAGGRKEVFGGGVRRTVSQLVFRHRQRRNCAVFKIYTLSWNETYFFNYFLKSLLFTFVGRIRPGGRSLDIPALDCYIMSYKWVP